LIFSPNADSVLSRAFGGSPEMDEAVAKARAAAAACWSMTEPLIERSVEASAAADWRINFFILDLGLSWMTSMRTSSISQALNGRVWSAMTTEEKEKEKEEEEPTRWNLEYPFDNSFPQFHLHYRLCLIEMYSYRQSD
jgi:hypothetical protein